MRVLVLCLVLTLTGCGDSGPATSISAPAAAPSLALTKDLDEAVSVIEARLEDPGTKVAVVGRVQGIVQGLAAFRVVDDDYKWCGRGDEDCGCLTPWDYCCAGPDVHTRAMLPIELRDTQGNPIEVDRRALGLRELDLIAVEGVIEKTASGGLVLVSRGGYFRRERPEITKAGIKWPE